MGGLWCSHPGPPSVPSRLDPGDSRLEGTYPTVGGCRLGCSPAGSSCGQGDSPCPAGTGGGTWLPNHPLLQGNRDLAMLAHVERERGEGLRAPLQGGGAALPAGVSSSLNSYPIRQQLSPQLPIDPGRVTMTGREVAQGCWPCRVLMVYPWWVVCRCSHSRWCSTCRPQCSHCRCHTAPGRAPRSPAAPRGTRQASLQHGGSLVTVRSVAVLGFCPQSCSWHGLSLHPVPVLCFHLPSHSTIMTSVTSLTPLPVSPSETSHSQYGVSAGSWSGEGKPFLWLQQHAV